MHTRKRLKLFKARKEEFNLSVYLKIELSYSRYGLKNNFIGNSYANEFDSLSKRVSSLRHSAHAARHLKLSRFRESGESRGIIAERQRELPRSLFAPASQDNSRCATIPCNFPSITDTR